MKRLRERKRLRMEGYDYSTPNHYFVTICVQDFAPVFGDIINNNMNLNKYGRIVRDRWLWLEKHYQYVCLDEYVVMPDHFHGIIEIIDIDTRRGGSRSTPTMKIKPLPELVGAFKTTSSKLIHQNGLYDFQWQRSFWDRIIGSDREPACNAMRNIADRLENVREYIRKNPENY